MTARCSLGAGVPRHQRPRKLLGLWQLAVGPDCAVSPVAPVW